MGESQSNGAVESQVKEIRGMYKTMRSDIETSYGKAIPGDHPIQPWIVRHASTMRFRESIGQDGGTACSRVKRREFKKEIIKIGECVWYMKPKSKHKRKGDYSWGDGIWLGIRDESGEYIIGTSKGVIKVRSVRRKGSHEDRWEIEQLNAMRGTPWEPVPGSPGTEIKSRIAPDREEKDVIPREDGEDREVRLKEFRIERRDVFDNGPTRGCPGCDKVITGGIARNHSKTCRSRFEKIFIDKGDPKLLRQARRFMAEDEDVGRREDEREIPEMSKEDEEMKEVGPEEEDEEMEQQDNTGEL